MPPDSPAGNTLLARWVMPIVGAPIENGVVEVAGDRIVAVRRRRPADAVVDLGDVALLPGLVNPHTHCEFGELTAPLGESGQSFASWIPKVIEYRRERGATCLAAGHDADHWRQAGCDASLREMADAAVVAIGEIATTDWPPRRTGGPLHATIFLEQLGLSPVLRESHREAATRHLSWDTLPACQKGLSPHAPYTASLTTVRDICELSAKHGTPVAMHLAESPDEMEMLHSQRGPLVDLLSQKGLWFPHEISQIGVQPYLDALDLSPRALVIHGNYLERDAWRFLAQRSGHMHVIYCPRTASRFIDRPYPLAAMLSEGVSVAIATDSRASNPDLSLFNDLKAASALHPSVDPHEILKMGTVNGAVALGIDEQFGSLAVGRLARFALVEGFDPTSDPRLIASCLLAPKTRIGTLWR